ncbi:MAG: flavodoxin [Flavobacteriales bacterium]|nr:flavodoxin [Flavobacteriales bacterium]|tara:strand:+ start:5526 stop:6071 length:546 start_codon:yes stop_codon:yes gene_type:complete
MRIGLFFGSDTGRTTAAAEQIKETLSNKLTIDMFDVVDFDKNELEKYDHLIIGLSTWFDGELQSDWDTNFNEFCEVDFTNKVVALYGLGDQIVYCDYFIDGVGILAEQILKKGGTLIGKWPTEGYLHTDSKAELEDGVFCGLALDEDTQEEMTAERIVSWCEQIYNEFIALEINLHGAYSQ